MQTQDIHRPLLEAFIASRPFVLSIGRCATIDGDPRPFIVTGWTGPQYELSSLAGDELEIINRPVSEVTITPGTPCRVVAS